MESWIHFWQILLIVVFTLFYCVVLFIIPFGMKDMLALFRSLKAQAEQNKQNKQNKKEPTTRG